MDNQSSNLLKNTQTLLQNNHNDQSRFDSLYQELAQPDLREEANLAQKVGPLTQNQLYLLRSQILAYKHLVRNIPVPSNLLWSGMNSQTWLSEKQKLTAKAITFYRDKLQKQTELKSMIMETVKPNKEAEDADFSKALVQKRKNQIDHILDRPEQLDQNLKQRLTVQSRFLQLRDVYQKVFYKIAEGMRKDDRETRLFERNLLDRSYFRRQKQQRTRQAGNKSQKLQSQMRSDHQRRKKIKHRQFMQHLRAHKQQFLEWHRKKQRERKKLITMAKGVIDNKKKMKEDNQTKEYRKRIDILKNNDIGSYMKIIKEAKNNKIQELLSQTNRFLKELGAKVLIQKGNTQDDKQAIQIKQNSANQEDIQITFNNSNSVYYNLTHTVKQEIKKQPTILQGGQLKNYQLVGLQWLTSLYNNKLNGILADEMGLGKTIQTIALLAYLIEFKKNYGPFLIVVPLSTISNWVNEFEKWAPSIRKIVYKGNPNTRTEIYKIMMAPAAKWNVCITTYDFILKDRHKLNKKYWKYIIIDEGHKMKNSKSKFAGVLGQQYQSDNRLLLTGTPLQNNLGQLWALLNFLLPKVFNSCDDFEKWFSMAMTKGAGGQVIQLNEEEQLLIINRLHQVLRPFLLRRIKKEVESQLPDKEEHVLKVQLSAWQKMIYDNISTKSAMVISSSEGNTNTKTLSNLMMQLRKCCNHPYMFLNDYREFCYHDWIFRSSGKLQLLDRILPKLFQFGHRILIFSQMTQLMNIMENYFQYKGIKHLRLDGSTKTQDRQTRTMQFNQPNSPYDIFLLSTRAGGLGLNLQTADTVIIFDSDWNPQMDLQAQDRAHRIGQKKKVLVLRFVTKTPIEETILQRAAFKIGLDQMFIQGGMYNLNSSEVQRRKKIQDVLKKTNKDDDDEQDQIPSDQMINTYISRSPEEQIRFNQMDQQRVEREKSMYVIPPKSKSNYNYRLMQEDQIPKWFTQAPVKKQKTTQVGKGKRLKKVVNYCDDALDHLLQMSEQFDQQSQRKPQASRKRGDKSASEFEHSEMKSQNEPVQYYE